MKLGIQSGKLKIKSDTPKGLRAVSCGCCCDIFPKTTIADYQAATGVDPTGAGFKVFTKKEWEAEYAKWNGQNQQIDASFAISGGVSASLSNWSWNDRSYYGTGGSLSINGPAQNSTSYQLQESSCGGVEKVLSRTLTGYWAASGVARDIPFEDPILIGSVSGQFSEKFDFFYQDIIPWLAACVDDVANPTIVCAYVNIYGRQITTKPEWPYGDGVFGYLQKRDEFDFAAGVPPLIITTVPQSPWWQPITFVECGTLSLIGLEEGDTYTANIYCNNPELLPAGVASAPSYNAFNSGTVLTNPGWQVTQASYTIQLVPPL